MTDWVANQDDNKDTFSLASEESSNVSSIAKEEVEKTGQDSKKPREEITQLGSSYQIKDVTVSKRAKRDFPTILLALIVVLPVILIFTVSSLSNRNKNPQESFIFDTLESKYFTLSTPPEYEVKSIIDKKIPYLEMHTLISDADGQKTLTITVKDVKFDYDLADNKDVIARRDNPTIWSEEDYELNAKQGLYFKKTDENFDHLVLLVDRNRSLLYEIRLFSPTNFANDSALAEELQSILKGMTFL